MGLCGDIETKTLAQANNAINLFSEKGSRTIAVAVSEDESSSHFRLVGLFANDFVTMTIATDHAKSNDSPNKWEIKNITLSSFILGLFFGLEDLVLVYIGLNYFQLDFDKLQTLVTFT